MDGATSGQRNNPWKPVGLSTNATHMKDGGALFQQAIRHFGPEKFTWEVLAEGRADVIRILEGAMISHWNLTGLWTGWNGRGEVCDFSN